MKSFTVLALATLAAFAATPAFADPASCPTASEQLADLLDGTMKRVGREGELTAAFDVDAEGHVQAAAVEGPRSYRWPVRQAIGMLDCQAGTPQRYVVSIRFTDPARHSVDAKPPVAVAVALAASTPR